MKRTMTLRVILAATLLAIAAPAIAAPSNMDQYKAQMERAQKAVNIAEVATMCGLRSQRWLEVFEDGYQLLATSEASRLGLGSAGLDASDAMAERVAREARAGLTCAKLANSPVMDKLDDIHHQLTAGYQ